ARQVDVEPGERRATLSHVKPGAESLPDEKLFLLQRIEDRGASVGSSDARRQSVEIDDRASRERRSRPTPKRPQQTELGVGLTGELPLDSIGSGEQADNNARPLTVAHRDGATAGEDFERAFDFAHVGFRLDPAGNVLGLGGHKTLAIRMLL